MSHYNKIRVNFLKRELLTTSHRCSKAVRGLAPLNIIVIPVGFSFNEVF